MGNSNRVVVGDTTYTLESFSGRKGIRVLRTLEEISKAAPELQKKWQDYTRRYEAENTIDLDRAYARAEYAPKPLYLEQPVMVDGEVVIAPDGRPLIRREPLLDENGVVRMGPDPLGHLTDADWSASGNKLKQPRSPTLQDQVMSIFPDMVELAEKETAALLGLICMSNQDVKHAVRDGSIREKAAEIGDQLLDAPFEEIVELAVVAGELVTEQYREKVMGKLGPRLKSILALVGINLTLVPSTTESSTTSQTSSTDSPSPTDGAKSSASTEPAGVASAS